MFLVSTLDVHDIDIVAFTIFTTMASEVVGPCWFLLPCRHCSHAMMIGRPVHHVFPWGVESVNGWQKLLARSWWPASRAICRRWTKALARTEPRSKTLPPSWRSILGFHTQAMRCLKCRFKVGNREKSDVGTLDSGCGIHAPGFPGYLISSDWHKRKDQFAHMDLVWMCCFGFYGSWIGWCAFTVNPSTVTTDQHFFWLLSNHTCSAIIVPNSPGPHLTINDPNSQQIHPTTNWATKTEVI